MEPRRPQPDAQRQARFWPLWIASSVVPLLAMLGAAWLSWSRVQQGAEAQLRSNVEMLHQHALRAFDSQRALLALLQWQTQGMSWDEIATTAELSAMLSHLAEATPGTSNIGIVQPDGRLAHISSAPFPPPPIDFSDRDYVRHQRGPDAGFFLSAPLVGRLGGNVAFSYSHPRLDGAGRPDGGLFWTTFRQAGFNSVYAGLLRGTRDEIALLRTSDGTILASHPPTQPPPPGGQAPPRNAVGMGAAAAAALARPGEVALVRGVSPLDGETRLYAARALVGVPAVVVQGLHPAGPRGAWRGEVAGLAGVAAATTLVLLLLTWRARGATQREASALAQGRAAAEGRAEAEAMLRQRDRLHLLGEVTAGVAHDFRNVVQAVQGGTVLAGKALDAGDLGRARTLLAMIHEAVGRGAALTDRMLRAARRDGGVEGRAAALDPAAAVRMTAELLARTLPAGYPVVLDIQPEGLPPLVRGDASDLEAALLNLAFNARDAMPAGGTIALSLAAETAGEEMPAQLRRYRRHARITVADSGMGMDAATLLRIGDTFFTTKPPGKGTGLGLASVRAFLRGAGGTLRVDSAGPGQGATVTLWLPEAEAEQG